MTIEIVNLHKGMCDDFGKYPYDVYIGWSQFYQGKRLPTSPYHNPYSWKKHGRVESINLYRTVTVRYLNLDPLKEVHARTGQLRLGCWCVPDPCHGQVLKELIEGRS